MKNKDFAVFILTHGRPDNVVTVKTLRNQGYTGDIYFIVDNEDKTVEKYIQNFGKDKVYIFDKKKYADQVDEGNNFDERRTITHARNASFDIAQKIGVKYFVQLDDDYTNFTYLYDNHKEFAPKRITKLDDVFYLFLKYYASNDNITTLAFLQEGDLIGGAANTYLISGKYPFIKRKCMNSFFCSTDRKFQFVGAMNEDVNTYTTLGSRGHVFLSIPLVKLSQKETQSQAGGITDMYLLYGTYSKAFTTVIMMPSSVKVAMMQSKFARLHHSINWRNTVPKILSESVKHQPYA